MRRSLLIVLTCLLLPCHLVADTISFEGRIIVNYIMKCKNGYDTIVSKNPRCKMTQYDFYANRDSTDLGTTDINGKFKCTLKGKKIGYLYVTFTHLESGNRRFTSNRELLLMKSDKDSILEMNIFINDSLGQTLPFQQNAVLRKPAIYLYPEQETQISVKLDFKGKLGTTFPKYYNGWTVTAKPNGELTNASDKRKYNYLFWEGSYNFSYEHYNYRNGFVVPHQVLDKFFIDKLSYIGLNNTEINDFIVYWLPILEKNEYSLIHFFINDNIDNTAFLQVDPFPDTKIRVYMEYKAVDSTYKTPEQDLPQIERKGFTLVEWGGGMCDSNKIE